MPTTGTGNPQELEEGVVRLGGTEEGWAAEQTAAQAPLTCDRYPLLPTCLSLWPVRHVTYAAVGHWNAQKGSTACAAQGTLPSTRPEDSVTPTW